MKLVVTAIAMAIALTSVGCATRAVQTEALLSSPQDLPGSHKIENVPFINQTTGHCGPATLTMAMRFAGQDVSFEEISTLTYTPGLKGTLQQDLISASRRQGMMAIPIHNLSALLKEVSAGHPVIVFENLALSWAPQWHYALVFGYDLQKQEVIMHSGPNAFYHWDMKKFERSWMLGDYWGLVVLPAGELAVSAGEITHATAAVGLESANKTPEAEKSYRKILEKWPTSLVTLIGLANLAFKKGDRKEARRLLQVAVKAHPESAAAKHNLAIVSQPAKKTSSKD